MKEFAAICPHSGGLPAEEFVTRAETLKDAHAEFWRMCIGSRYVGDIYEKQDGKWVRVWQEGESLEGKR